MLLCRRNHRLQAQKTYNDVCVNGRLSLRGHIQLAARPLRNRWPLSECREVHELLEVACVDSRQSWSRSYWLPS